MPLKRSFVPIILLILLLLATGMVAWFLPFYIERRILPQFFQNAGVREYTVAVRRLGFSGLDLGRITLGNAKNPWLSVDTIQVDYSLSGIVGREINAIVVSGLQIEAAVQDGGIVFPGLKTARLPDARPAADRSLQLPVTIDRMSVRNAILAITFNGGKISVPFTLQARRNKDATIDAPTAIYDCLLQLQPRGQEVQLSAKATLPGNRVDINLVTDSLHLDVFSDLIEMAVPMTAGGTATIHAATAVMISPLELIKADADCKFYNSRIIAGNTRLRNRTGVDQQEIPIQLQINGDREKVTFAATGLVVDTPFPVHVPVVEGTISYSAATVDMQGDLQFELADDGRMSETARNPVRIMADFSGHYSPSTHDWRLTIPTTENRPAGSTAPFGYSYGSLALAYDKAIFSLDGEGSGAIGALDYMLKLAGVSVTSETVAVKAPIASLIGHTLLENDTSIETRFAGDFPGVHMAAGPTSMQGDVSVAAALSPAGQPSAAEADAVSLQGRIKLTNFTVLEKGLEIQADAIHGEIPFLWPPPSTGDRGEVIFPAIRWQQKDLGSLTVAVWQQGSGLEFEGGHENRLIKGFSLNFSGQATYAAREGLVASCVFNTPSAADQVETDLGMLRSALQGLFLRGRMRLDGDGSLNRGIVRARLNSRLQDGTLRAPEKKLLIEGINGSLSFADLLEMRSNPQQKLRFNRATFGDFTFEDGDIDFQLESDKSFLIEKSTCKWAGGSVYTQALRMRPGVDNYDLTVFCDRLKLASLLKQFGAADAEGDGAVSGRIPLVYADGKVFLGDGFLYSTPGEGGTIRVVGADALAAGIPKNTPQFAQIDFAMEALKNFSYKWVKLQTKTEGENLVLAMQLDGMPDHTLPFRYDSSIGQFSRIDLQTEKGILQPIRLDVNFRLPLNSLLDYGKGIGKLIDRMK